MVTVAPTFNTVCIRNKLLTRKWCKNEPLDFAEDRSCYIYLAIRWNRRGKGEEGRGRVGTEKGFRNFPQYINQPCVTSDI